MNKTAWRNLITNQKYLNDGIDRCFRIAFQEKAIRMAPFQITLYHDSPAIRTRSKS